MIVARYADRPDLRERREEVGSFPEFMYHNSMGGRYWRRLYDEHPAFQLVLVDGDDPVAEVHALPVPVDGDQLPRGWDEAFELGMERGGGTVLSLLSMSVVAGRRGGGLAAMLIEAERRAASAAGLAGVIAPVRPTLKERYPLVPIERYVLWRRDDGSHFDPWLRVHERVGGTIVGVAPESMRMEAPVAEWAEWVGMAFPEDGVYVAPGMLAPLEVRGGIGVHVEPNIWVRHAV